MHEDILAIAISVLQHPNQFDDLGMDPMNPKFKHGSLTSLTDRVFNFTFSFFDDLLNTARINASIRDQALERDARNFSSNGTMTRNQHRLWSIINHQIDPSRSLKRSDVASFTANNTTLHIVAGEMNNRRGPLGNKLAGQAFNRNTDNFPSPPGRFFSGFLFYGHNPS